MWSLQALDEQAIEVTANTPAAARALDYLHELLAISPPGVLDLAWDEALEVFLAGRAAMAYCWSMRATRFEADVRSKVKGRVRYLAQPAGHGGANVCPLGGFLLAVPANLPEQRVDAAFEAIRWMTSPDAIRTQRATGFPVLPRFSISGDAGHPGGSALVGFVNELARRNLLATWQRPPLAVYPAVEAILGEEIHACLRGDKTDADALLSVQERIEAALEATRHASRRPSPSGARDSAAGTR